MLGEIGSSITTPLISVANSGMKLGTIFDALMLSEHSRSPIRNDERGFVRCMLTRILDIGRSSFSVMKPSS